MSSPAATRVLIVDDEKNIRATLQVCLEGIGCEVAQAATRAAALEAIRETAFDLAFLDLRVGSESGMELLRDLLAERPGLEVIVVTAYATFDTAVEAIRLGARDYLPKPFSPAQIRYVVERVREHRREQGELRDLRSRLGATEPQTVIESKSPKLRAVVDMLSRAAEFDAPILLLGENGTGKSVLARFVHSLSHRREHPFVTVNCPTLSEELLASELFGHARGSFTGAVRDRAGRVEAAEGGTLFLDEIGELPVGLQTKLLGFLQEKTFERVGESRLRKADVRIVVATNRDLKQAVQQGTFREDLLHRLNTIEATVPALRERREDIVPLARAFVSFFARTLGRPEATLTAEAERWLEAGDWTGNVRELRNAVERALILSGGVVLGPEAFGYRAPVPMGAAGPAIGSDFTVDEIERAHIEAVLARLPTQEQAARVLGLDASTLWRKRKKYEG